MKTNTKEPAQPRITRHFHRDHENGVHIEHLYKSPVDDSDIRPGAVVYGIAPNGHCYDFPVVKRCGRRSYLSGQGFTVPMTLVRPVAVRVSSQKVDELPATVTYAQVSA